jgi:hypothetical protein
MVEATNNNAQDTSSPSDGSKEEIPPLFVDAWVASSLLQKAIRRGDADTAVRAGVTLYHYRRSAIWRRLFVIAYEDVAASLEDLFDEVILVGTDFTQHSNFTGELAAVVHIIRNLADAPKDRSADYLVSIAAHHPSLTEARANLLSSPFKNQLAAVSDPIAPLERRALAAWSIREAVQTGREVSRSAEVALLLETYRAIGIPDRLVRAARLAFKRSREVMVLIQPLIWIAMSEDQEIKATHHEQPASPIVRDVPLYAFDKHTRLGKTAIRRFLAENSEVRELLLQHVSQKAALNAAGTAAFYADAAPIGLRLDWKLSRYLEARGMEADLYRDGIPLQDAKPIVDTVGRNLPHLNEIRKTLWKPH